jgi:hypothetical protein
MMISRSLARWAVFALGMHLLVLSPSWVTDEKRDNNAKAAMNRRVPKAGFHRLLLALRDLHGHPPDTQ